MNPAARLTLLILACLVPLAVASADGQAPAIEGTPSLIDRFLTPDELPLREYRARRTLRAVNTRFHAKATLEAITELTRDGTFRYEIVREEGSGLRSVKGVTGGSARRAALVAARRSTTQVTESPK